MQRLRLLVHAAGGNGRVTAASVAALDEHILAIAIRDVRFARVKASRILRLAAILRDERAGDVPFDIADLLALPGVGPKSAQRMAYHLLERNRDGGRLLARALSAAMDGIGHCERCGTLTEETLCDGEDGLTMVTQLDDATLEECA